MQVWQVIQQTRDLYWMHLFYPFWSIRLLRKNKNEHLPISGQFQTANYLIKS